MEKFELQMRMLPASAGKVVQLPPEFLCQVVAQVGLWGRPRASAFVRTCDAFSPATRLGDYPLFIHSEQLSFLE